MVEVVFALLVRQSAITLEFFPTAITFFKRFWVLELRGVIVYLGMIGNFKSFIVIFKTFLITSCFRVLRNLLVSTISPKFLTFLQGSRFSF